MTPNPLSRASGVADGKVGLSPEWSTWIYGEKSGTRIVTRTVCNLYHHSTYPEIDLTQNELTSVKEFGSLFIDHGPFHETLKNPPCLFLLHRHTFVPSGLLNKHPPRPYTRPGSI